MKKENILVVVLMSIALAGLFWFFNADSGQKNLGAGKLVAQTQSPNASVTGDADPGNGNATQNNRIDWKDYTPGLAQAKTQDKNVFLYFYAQWCTYCTQLSQTTFLDAKVQAYLDKHFVSISVDTDQNQTLSRSWQVKGLPTMWFLTPEGNKISSLPGYVGAAQLFQILKFIHTDSYHTMSFQEFVKQ